MESRIILAGIVWLLADALDILRDSVEISREGLLWLGGKLAGLPS